MLSREGFSPPPAPRAAAAPALLVHRTGAELVACHTLRPPMQYPISASMIKALTHGTDTTSVSVSFSDQPSFLPSVVRGHVWMVRREQGKPFILYFSLPFVYDLCCDTRKTGLTWAL